MILSTVNCGLYVKNIQQSLFGNTACVRLIHVLTPSHPPAGPPKERKSKEQLIGKGKDRSKYEEIRSSSRRKLVGGRTENKLNELRAEKKLPQDRTAHIHEIKGDQDATDESIKRLDLQKVVKSVDKNTFES